MATELLSEPGARLLSVRATSHWATIPDAQLDQRSSGRPLHTRKNWNPGNLSLPA
jgi:hypothetical protein